MRLPSPGIPAVLGAGLLLLLVLLPQQDRAPRRDVARDIDRLRRAECRYRGITATFEDLTRAYLLETYEEGEVIDWVGEPSRRNPDSETLVTAWCRLGAPRQVVDVAVPDSIQARRRAARPRAPVIWRYSTLAAVRVEAGNMFAQDALNSFRSTIDRFMRSMVIADQPLMLRAAGEPDAAGVLGVEPGTVLLREAAPEAQPSFPGWSYVRIPSTPTRGWVEAHKLIPVENE